MELFSAPKTSFLFEVSWEVCNKVGGIYTVLASKANSLIPDFSDQMIFVGPDLGTVNDAFFREDASLYQSFGETMNMLGLPVRIGRWTVHGEPVAILVDFASMMEHNDQLFANMWQSYGVDSLRANGDYFEACAFAHAAGKVIEAFCEWQSLEQSPVLAHFHEWTTGMGLLYVKRQLPYVATLFTTHATSIGRSICSNGKDLYAYFDGYNGDVMAAELSMEAKHSLEKIAAREADCFTTVSETTARECRQLLGKNPDVITPNGFDLDQVPAPRSLAAKRRVARKLLLKMVGALSGYTPADDALLIGTSGRYEYRNKGIDLFIASLGELRKLQPEREVIAFVMVPGWLMEARKDLAARMAMKDQPAEALEVPQLSHWIHEMWSDKVLGYVNYLGLMNRPEDRVKVVFVPSYLNGDDGILNKPYYELLMGLDLTLFPSYYEPWGYTPHESVAHAIPTITTQWAGFGVWAEATLGGASGWLKGVAVIKREEAQFDATAQQIAQTVYDVAAAKPAQIKMARANAQLLATKAEWTLFSEYYREAYRIALSKHQ